MVPKESTRRSPVKKYFLIKMQVDTSAVVTVEKRIRVKNNFVEFYPHFIHDVVVFYFKGCNPHVVDFR